jgi:hypothetical protein
MAHMLFFWGICARNRARIVCIRDQSPTAVETLARMFTDASIFDDGAVPDRLRAILAATEHRFVPGLHTGIWIGFSGFRKEFEDPWRSSADQAGHFLTAVRLAFDASFLANPIFRLLLGSSGAKDDALRLIIGHEKAPDPPDIDRLTLGRLLTALQHFRRQYQSVSSEDVANFQHGNLDAIRIGTGVGNSIADLRLSYKGWLFGQWANEGRFGSREEVARWVREELGHG